MKKLLFLLSAAAWLLGNDTAHEFAKSAECQACHPKIYEEYYGSMHANATPDKDPIHKAVWDKHPHKNKFEQYSCGKCHSPAADNLDAMLAKGQKALHDSKNETHQEAVGCAYCHRIQSIEHGKMNNTNIISKEKLSFYGSTRSSLESPYHKIITEKNEHFSNGNVCIGCHSHNLNAHGLNLCSTNVNDEMSTSNCVSCHMPKVEGSFSSIIETKTHSFHGFAGAHANSDMLKKYVQISLLRNTDHFIVNVDNQTSHALLLHPMRLAVLKISVTRDGKTEALAEEQFVRVIGKENKPAMPWVADATLKDSMVKANEKRAVRRDFKLEKGDRVDVTLGWFLVHPQSLKSLGLENEKAAKEFHVFKKESFSF
ncbi:MAG: multiheme c-type cytochrome [Sulfurimonas sp.]|uniref:multiheme c-type cytochrome n=1 Tax=Sulfurimonas sp. TaxID=2022749 RepID=UPI0026176D14|nr:multiheme c-type cytochrome [Sulfurimonas sp.]MDD2651826.1 multiheme c-type cytochrome [Sulfurimonas sp.]MDD3451622.1 multiheme c-type cytochrome [Sulfurimonas sp.]